MPAETARETPPPPAAPVRRPGPFQHLTDQQFSERFVAAGRVNKRSRDVSAGMVPEAAHRETHRRHGCATIEEFAGKTAGLTKHYVRKVLAVYDKIADKPELSRLLQTGEVGWSKMRTVAGVATTETDALWAGLVRTLSKAALEAHVRAWRLEHPVADAGAAPSRAKAGPSATPAFTAAESAESATEPSGGAKGPGVPPAAGPGPAPGPAGAADAHDAECDGGDETADATDAPLPPTHRVAIVVNVLAAEEFKRLAEDLRRRHKRPFSDSEVLVAAVREFRGREPGPRSYREVIYRAPDGQRVKMTRWGLVRVTDEWFEGAEPAGAPVDLEHERQECEREAERAAGGVVPGDQDDQAGARPSVPPLRQPNRHIPQAIRDHVFHRTSGFCEFPGCAHRATILHHVRRFALDPRHGPDDLVHLCRDHERLVHEGLVANELEPPALWRVKLDRKVGTPEEAARARVDAKVRDHRRPAG